MPVDFSDDVEESINADIETAAAALGKPDAAVEAGEGDRPAVDPFAARPLGDSKPPPALDSQPLAATAGAPPAEEAPVRDPAAPASGDSPWSGGREEERSPASRAPSQPISTVSAILLTIGTAIAVMVIGVWWVRRGATVEIPPLPASATTVAATAPPPTASASTAPTTDPTTAPTTDPSAAPTADPSATPTTEPSTEPSAAPPDDGKDGTDLLFTQGYLVVEFDGPQDAHVFIFGKDYGKVGDKLVVPCQRPAYVTVGSGPNNWLSKGQAVTVACRKVTRAAINPK